MLKLFFTYISKGILLFFCKLKNKLTGNTKNPDECLNNPLILKANEKLQTGLTPDKHEEILIKLKELMDTKKMFTNPDLSIKDVATMVGTNRSYISCTINYFYKVNFSTYLNKYRCYEFQKRFMETPEESCNELTKRAGFGSVDSMKRTILVVTGMQYKDWRAKALAELEEKNSSEN